jgi:hypothetical protein
MRIANNGDIQTVTDRPVGESFAMCTICMMTLGTVTYSEICWQIEDYYSHLRGKDEA